MSQYEAPAHPAVSGWKTSVLFSILGRGAYWAVALLASSVIAVALAESEGVYDPRFVGTISGKNVGLAMSALTVAYILLCLNSYFGVRPRLTSSKAISFWNFFFGGPLFGALWNTRLTQCRRGKKGRRGFSGTVCLLGSIVYILFLLVVPGSSIVDDYNQAGLYRLQGADGGALRDAVPFDDGEYGVEFLIPDGWGWIDVRKEGMPYQHTAFLASPGQFGSVEVGYAVDGEAPSSFRSMGETTKSEVASNFASSLGDNPREVSIEEVRYGGRAYWRLTATADVASRGQMRPYYGIYLIRWDSRALYAFFYMEVSQGEGFHGTDEYVDAFEGMMESVRYDDL